MVGIGSGEGALAVSIPVEKRLLQMLMLENMIMVQMLMPKTMILIVMLLLVTMINHDIHGI